MSKQAIDAQDRTMNGHFGRFSAAASGWLGSTWAFVGACLVVVAWAAIGTLFHFLIQNTQNRDARAIHLKLNELIRAMDSARNQMIDIEKLSDLELDAMQATYEKIKTSWTERQSRSPRGAQEK